MATSPQCAPRLNVHGQPIGPPINISYYLPRPLPSSTEVIRGDADFTYLLMEPLAKNSTGVHSLQQLVDKSASLIDPRRYAIVATDHPSNPTHLHNKAVGMASYMRIQREHGVIEVGNILVSRPAQRSRISTEAQFLMMRHAFEVLGYRRYEWKCDTLNAPSRAAAQRLGFTYEGTFRQAIVYKGRSRDTAWYAVTEAHWPTVREAFEQWLSDTNFNAQGLQIQSLQRLRAKL